MSPSKHHSSAHRITQEIMLMEERIVIAQAELSVISSDNPKIHGANGEKIIMSFYRRHLPSCFRVSTGHILHPRGAMSPEIDLMLIDARYPPFAVLADDTTLEVLDAVVSVVSVKKRLNKKEFIEQDVYCQRLRRFFLMPRPSENRDGILALPFPDCYVLAYRTTVRERTIVRYMSTADGLCDPHFTLVCLNTVGSDVKLGLGHGLLVRWDLQEHDELALMSIPSTSPLSDQFFSMLDLAYSSIMCRNASLEDIRASLSNYWKYGRA